MRIKKTVFYYLVIIIIIAVFINSSAQSGYSGKPARPETQSGNPRNYITQPKTSFSDVGPSDWYYQYIEELADKKLARGNPDGTYAPDAYLLVDEFLAFTLRTLGYDLPNCEVYWARHFIEQALALGLILPGEYDSYDTPITRGQIAVIAVRASGEDFPEYKKHRGIFSDLRTSEDQESILKAIEFGVLAGYEDGTFKPNNTATRAEASVIILRMIDDTYKLKLYGDIFFNPKTDLNDAGVMKKEKSEDFIMKAVSDMHIGVSPGGKAVISGDIPELPPGQNFMYNVSFYDRTGTYLAYHSTSSMIEDQLIPPVGKYEIETKANKKDIGHITIRMSINEGELPWNIQEAAAAFTIYKYYHNTGHANEGFVLNADGIEGILRYDFDKTRGIWSW
jgi:hypothetical protein